MKDKDIIAKYPKVFGEPPYDPMHSLLCFGFECGEGWFPLIENLAKEINEELEKEPLEGFYVTQVKSKFGGLRFYTSCGNEKIFNLIEKAEYISEETCEKCGKPGKMIDTGWIVCLCNECLEKKGK